MNTAKYTPGPWEANIRTVQPEMGGNHEINATVRLSGGRMVHLGSGRVRTNPELSANAYLIAAAPELLEALQAIVSQVSKHQSSFFDFVNDPATFDAFERARAAIAKATGAP